MFDELMPSALDGALPLGELLSDYFVRDLHARMFGPVWNWAGRWRRLELNVGVAPEQIAVELRNALDTIDHGKIYVSDHLTSVRARMGISIQPARLRMGRDKGTSSCKTTDEPLTWNPPEHLLKDLPLPGPDPDSIDLPRLHRLVRKPLSL